MRRLSLTQGGNEAFKTMNNSTIYYYGSNKISSPKDIQGALRSRNELGQNRRIKLAQIWAKLTLI